MNVNRHLAWTLTAAVIVTTASVAGARQLVQMRLRGYFYNAPATVQITVAVEPDVRNRRLLIEADGSQMFRSTEVTLNGADAERVHTIEFRNLAEGGYVLRASVASETEVLGSVEQRLTVEGH